MGIDKVGQAKAVFLDRDGVLNENVFYADTGAWESPRTVADFKLFPETIPSLQQLQRAGFLLFLVSNQPNVAKGKSTMEELQAIQASLCSSLEPADIRFTDFFYCYHHPESTLPPFGGACVCRKPSPYFLLQAAATHAIDMASSWMIGDRRSDIACGNKAHVRTVFIAAPGQPEDNNAAVEETPSAVAPNLSAAAAIVLGNT